VSMAKRLVLILVGWPITLQECPPGMFLYENRVLHVSSDFGVISVRPISGNWIDVYPS